MSVGIITTNDNLFGCTIIYTDTPGADPGLAGGGGANL